jgi:hypothetical protein
MEDLFGTVHEDNVDDGFDDGFDDNDREDAQQFVSTWDQQQSSSEQNDCYQIAPNLNPEERRKVMASLSPIEHLQVRIGSIVHTLNEADNQLIADTISSEQRNYLCRQVLKLTDINNQPKYINALAYVLGYMVFNINALILESDNKHERKIKVTKLRKLFLCPTKIDKITNDNFINLDNINNNVRNTTASDDLYSVFPADVIRYALLWSRLDKLKS